MNGKNGFERVLNKNRVYESATGHKPFFPYMTKIINGFYVYDFEKGFIKYFKNGKKGLFPVALS